MPQKVQKSRGWRRVVKGVQAMKSTLWTETLEFWRWKVPISRFTPRGPKSWKFSRSPSGIEIFKRDWNEWHFQARLKISSKPPTKPHIFVGNSQGQDWKFQARLKFSSEIEHFKRNLEIFKRSSEIDFFQDSGPLGTSRFSPSLIHGLCAFFASHSRFMRLFKAALDTPLDSTGRIRFRRVRFQTPNSVSFFWAHWVLGTELSEFLSAYYLCANANSPSFSQNSPSLPQNSVSSLLRNSTLETVFRPFPTLDSPSSAILSVHGLHFTVCAPSRLERGLEGLEKGWGGLGTLHLRPCPPARNCFGPEARKPLSSRRAGSQFDTSKAPECTKIARFSAAAVAILPLTQKSREFLGPQDARFPLRRKSLANRDFFCEYNG